MESNRSPGEWLYGPAEVDRCLPSKGLRFNRRSITKDILSAFIIILSILALPACIPQPAVEVPPVFQATLDITEIIDKDTREPVAVNQIHILWIRADGRIIQEENYENQTTVSADFWANGSEQILVRISAPGYEDWETSHISFVNAPHVVPRSAELERISETQ
jgi:hypothetical protein